MDKKFIELWKEKNKLSMDIRNLNVDIRQITDFIDQRAAYFKKEKSLKAIREIKNYLNRANLDLEEKTAKKEQIEKLLHKECKHPIIIGDNTWWNKFCPICGTFYGNIDENKPICIRIDEYGYFELVEILCNGDLRNKYGLSMLYESDDFIMNSVGKIIDFINRAINSEDTYSFISENIDELLKIEYDNRNIINNNSHKKLVSIRRK